MLYMKTYLHFWSYLTHFLLEWEIFHKKILEEIKILLMFNNFFRKSCLLLDKLEKYYTAGQALDDNMVHAHCMLDT